MIKEIGLALGYKTILDEDDYANLKGNKWHLFKGTSTFYARRNTSRTLRKLGKVKKTMELMHRSIMKPPCGLVVDHINGNGLDNRRCNLRICSQSENLINSKIRSSNTTGYKGVFRNKNTKFGKKWFARITRNYKMTHLGSFNTAEEASFAYKEASKWIR